jgi:hypothetical protein
MVYVAIEHFFDELHVAEMVKASAATSTCCHGAGVENGSRVAAVHDLMQALDHRFKKAIDTIRPRQLEKGAKYLRRGEGMVYGREGGGVQEMEESLDGETRMGQIQRPRAGVGG